MPFHCPKCEENIDEAVQASVKDRIERANAKTKAKETENEMLQRQLREAREQGKLAEQERKELGELRAERERTGQLELLKKHGIPDSALEDIVTLHKARMEGRDEGERVSLEDFLGPEGEGRKSALLEHYFEAGADGGSGEGGAGGGDTPDGLGSGDGGAPPVPPRGRKVEAKDVRAFFKSPEFRALPIEKQREKLQELQQTHGADLQQGHSRV